MSKIERAQYYEKAFERLEKENKHTWNWAACLFSGGWLLYRKMYLYTFIYLLINAICSLLLLGKDFKSLGMTEIIICMLLQMFIMCGFGYFGNRIYYHAVKKRISKGYHLLERYKPTSVLSAVFSLSAVFICFADFVSRKLQLKHIVEKDTNINIDSIRAYLNPSRKNHWAVNIVNVICFLLLIILVFRYVVLLLLGVAYLCL